MCLSRRKDDDDISMSERMTEFAYYDVGKGGLDGENRLGCGDRQSGRLTFTGRRGCFLQDSLMSLP